MSDMSDPISRQQTITALRALSDEDGYINAPHEVVTDVVRGLPPVQAEHGQTTQPERGESDKLASKMGGTWVDVTCPNCGCEIHVETEHKAGDCISRQGVIDFISDIEHTALKRINDNREDIPYQVVLATTKAIGGYCKIAPSAQPERPRGEWIEYDNSHCECPFCHEEWGYFDNEVEHFDFCPRCGADMRGETDGWFDKQTGSD